MSLTDLVFETPELLAVATVAVLALVRYQAGMSWSEYRTIHRLKVALFPRLERRTNLGVSFVNSKGGPVDDAEFVGRHAERPRAVARRILDAGAMYHVVCSVKRRPGDYDPDYSVAHLLFLHDDGTQTEVYLFRSASGSDRTDVYAHHETAVTDVDGHVRDTDQTDGDPRGVLDDAFDGDVYVPVNS